jgi:hypothetical protein
VANKRTRKLTQATAEVVATAEANGVTTPLAHMMAILNDPAAPAHRKDLAAAQAAPYMHPRLSMTASVDGANGAGRICSITLLAIPRGVFLSQREIDNPDLLLEHAVPFTPATPTPGVDELSAPPEPVPGPAPLPVEAVEVLDNPTLVRLDAWRRRSDDEPGAQ